MSYKGFFKCKHPEKYKGNTKAITYRSQWELRVMMWLDQEPKVTQWASEELAVYYVDPTNQHTRRYFPDFLATINEKTYMIEVKPAYQTIPSQAKTKRRFIRESLEFARNIAKWEAARRYCDKRNWTFKIMTERELFGANI
jgi:hypothetical protein